MVILLNAIVQRLDLTDLDAGTGFLEECIEGGGIGTTPGDRGLTGKPCWRMP